MAGPIRKLAKKREAPNPLVVAVQDYREVHAELIEYMDAHSEIFSGFFARVQKYNALLDKARAELQSADKLPAELDPEFRRAAKGSCKVSYKPELLPEHVACMEGLVTSVRTVNKDLLEKLIKKGTVSAEEVAPAKVETYSSPSVFVPAQLEFKFRRET